MKRRHLIGVYTLAVGLLVFSGGIAHNLVRLPELGSAVAAGEMSPRFAGEQVVETFFAGAAMNVLGLLVMMLSLELRKGTRAAWRAVLVIGVFYLLFGLVAFFYRYPNLHLLGFAVTGALLCWPLVLWRKDFVAQ